MKELEKIYDPSSVEDKHYKKWVDAGYFHAERDPDKRPYTIVMPPPNITGQLHMGHAMDETWQDILIRYKRMQGYAALWVPGTDHASIATEAKIVAKMKEEGLTKQDLGRDRFLERAWDWKKQYGGRIVEQLKKLGCSCDWQRERFTMDEGCSKAVLKVFKKLYDDGLIYRGERIINWCPHCKTSISDAEVEYEEQDGFFWHLKYPVAGGDEFVELATTRPETMLGDTAIAVHPDDERYTHLHGKKVILPLVGKEIPVVCDTYVDREFGTGVVKITPAHDPNDFEVGVRHGLPVVKVLTDDAHMTQDCGKYAGMDRYEARKAIVADLEAGGYLASIEPHKHNVGTCYRCGTTVEPMVSKQWFVKMVPLAGPAIEAVRDGRIWFVPERFDKPYYNWMENTRDWCISRQRTWGVPIPAFYCKKCGTYHITDATIKAVSALFRKEGSDAWYKYDAEQIIPAGEVCEKCGASEWEKDTDIMDVWFDSGSTHAAVLDERPELRFPADMYMEGGDQFRGWFQSSLLTSVASKGCAPYKSVLCHGWVVDEQGKQMHKSAGNGVEPSEIIKDYGADIIRLWVASSDYTVDVRAGKNIFKQLSEAYRKIRNTARFILGNLDGFDPNTDCVADDQLQDIDRWALAALDDLIANTNAGYAVYDFNKVYHAVYNFCVVAMSNFYLDVTKDRLYCTNGTARKAAQTTMYKILVALDKIIAPILCFTSQEIWDFMPKTEGMNKYVVFEQMPKAGQYAADDAFKAKWAQLIAVRDEVKKVLEQARAEKLIGASLEASVTLYCSDAVYDLLNSIPMDELADLMIVSHVELVKGEGGAASAVEGLGVAAAHATGDKCERCWKYSASIGSHPAHPTLCARCASVVEA